MPRLTASRLALALAGGALVVSLGGVAEAKKLLTGKDLKKGSITARELKNASFAARALPSTSPTASRITFSWPGVVSSSWLGSAGVNSRRSSVAGTSMVQPEG